MRFPEREGRAMNGRSLGTDIARAIGVEGGPIFLLGSNRHRQLLQEILLGSRLETADRVRAANPTGGEKEPVLCRYASYTDVALFRGSDRNARDHCVYEVASEYSANTRPCGRGACDRRVRSHQATFGVRFAVL